MNNSEVACINCFKDKILYEEIISFNKKGDCPWCNSQDVNVIPLYELGDMFRRVASLYKQVNNGIDTISFLLQDDWDIFSDKIEDDPELMQDLTISILESGIPHKELFSDFPNYNEGFQRPEEQLLEYWHERAEAYLTGDNLKVEAETGTADSYNYMPDFLEVVFEDLAVIYEPGHIFYRARIHKDRYRAELFSLAELGAPPPEKAEAGRANLKNKPVLYLANNDKSAIYEVRAWKGTAVAVAKVKLQQRINVVSLLDYELPESPFFQEEYLSYRVQLAELFYRLGEELSMPVMKHEEEQLYQSTQYLCELVRKAGYHGVKYPSSSDYGHNIVLFNPEYAEPIDITYIKIDDIEPIYHELRKHEPIYDEGPYDYLFSNVF